MNSSFSNSKFRLKKGGDGFKVCTGNRKKNGLKKGRTANGGRTMNGGRATGEIGLTTTAPGSTAVNGGRTSTTNAAALFAVPASNKATNANAAMILISFALICLSSFLSSFK